MTERAHAHPPSADVIEHYEREWSPVMRARLRAVTWVGLVWHVVVFFSKDLEVYQTWSRALLMRAPQCILLGLLVVWLGDRHRTRASMERWFVASALGIVAHSGFSVTFIPRDAVNLTLLSLGASMIALALAAEFTFRAAIALFAGTYAILGAGVLVRDAEEHLGALQLLGAGAAIPFTFAAAWARFRERSRLAEFVARRALATANAQLEQAAAERNRLFMHLAHDFRTPIAVILGEAHLIRTGDARTDEPARRIERNAESLGALTEDLLELARLDAGETPCRPEAVAIVEAARRTAAQFDGRAPVVVAGDEQLRAHVDPNHLARILANLLVNATRQSMASGGGVRLTARRSTESVLVDIEDDGPGIPEERRDLIFHRYASFDADGATVRGIGLPLARELAALNGGNLELVENTAKTTFRISLPAAVTPQAPAIASSLDDVPHASVPGATAIDILKAGVSSSPGSHAFRSEHGLPMPRDSRANPESNAPQASALHHGATTTSRASAEPRSGAPFLIVEDHAELRDVLAQLVAPFGDILTARTVEEALAVIDERTPSAILCDVLLPDGQGYSVLSRVRSTTRLDATPFLFISALGRVEDRVRGLAAGADDYIAKPFSPDELVARLRAASRRAEERARSLARQRQDLTMELHDGICGGLARAAVLLESRQRESEDTRVAGALAAVREGLVEARDILSILDAHVEPWSEYGPALRRELVEAADGADLRCEVAMRVPPDLILPPSTAGALRRIAREAMTNVIRHARAQQVSVEVEVTTERISFGMTDDGNGLGASHQPGRGLGIMQRRARRTGGDVTVRNMAPHGTRVEAILPLHP